MTDTTILAIDLGQCKCVARTSDEVTAPAVYRAVTTSRAGAERLIRTTGPSVVIIETCTPAGPTCGSSGASGGSCGPTRVGSRWQSGSANRGDERPVGPVRWLTRRAPGGRFAPARCPPGRPRVRAPVADRPVLT